LIQKIEIPSVRPLALSPADPRNAADCLKNRIALQIHHLAVSELPSPDALAIKPIRWAEAITAALL